MGHGPDQQRLDFNPIEATPEERERIRRIALEWTREEAEEDFTRLPGETLEEYLRERDLYVNGVVAFGGGMPKEPSVAWQMVQGRCRPPLPAPRQLKLPFDSLKPSS